jgi:DNA-binding NtrC family response regulator
VLLDGAPVLIAEDEPFIALDLAASVEEAGGVVIGPAGSVREAMAALNDNEVAAAILDVHLSDRDVTPVAEMLLERGVPIIVQTGVGLPEALQSRHPELRVHSKPISPSRIIRQLAALLRR